MQMLQRGVVNTMMIYKLFRSPLFPKKIPSYEYIQTVYENNMSGNLAKNEVIYDEYFKFK